MSSHCPVDQDKPGPISYHRHQSWHHGVADSHDAKI